MRPIVTDQVTWSVGLSVGLSLTLVSPAKMAEPIEIPFGLRIRVGPRNHVLDGVQITPGEGAILGKGTSIVKYRDFLPWAVQNAWTDRFVVWVVDSGGPKEAEVQSYSPGCANVPRRRAHWHIGATWRIRLNWTVHLRRRCGLKPNYFDHLLYFETRSRPVSS